MKLVSRTQVSFDTWDITICSCSIVACQASSAFMASPCEENKRTKSKTPTANKCDGRVLAKQKAKPYGLALLLRSCLYSIIRIASLGRVYGFNKML